MQVSDMLSFEMFVVAKVHILAGYRLLSTVS
jgi:hypothetical protein